jgi:F0F1-type ATP synthase membrane subunit b/b'
LKLARDQAAILSENSKKIFEEEIQRKQKQADLKIIQARDDAIREVKSKATDLSTLIAKEYLKENIDDKISSDLVDKSIEDLKRNL